MWRKSSFIHEQNVLLFLLFGVICISEVESKKKIIIIVPYRIDTIHHTHTKYIHIRDKPKEEPKKVDDHNYKHEWHESYEYHKGGEDNNSNDHESQKPHEDELEHTTPAREYTYNHHYKKGGSTEGHKNEFKLTEDYEEDSFEYGNQKEEHKDHKYGFEEHNDDYKHEHKDDEHDHSHDFKQGHDHDDTSTKSHEHHSSYEKEHEDWKKDKNYDKSEKDKSHDSWDTEKTQDEGKSKGYQVYEDQSNDNSVNEGVKSPAINNHNLGGGRHEWQSYSDLMDHHGKKVDLKTSGNQVVTLSKDDWKKVKNISKPEKFDKFHSNYSNMASLVYRIPTYGKPRPVNISRSYKQPDKFSNRSYINKSIVAPSEEYKMPVLGKPGALKSSYLDKGHRKWSYNY